MALVETESLILRSYPLAEADKIIVCLTQTDGLIRGVAKGAKRLKSRFGGGLEPFTIIDLIFYQKEEKELVSVREVELKKSFFEEASNPVFLQKFSYLTDILIDFTPPHEANDRLYRMVKVCLNAGAENPQTLDSIVLYFEVWLLRLAGYLPLWNKCDHCKRELNNKENANLQINFHLLCRDCQKSENGWVISGEHRQLFHLSQTVNPVKFIESTENKIERVKEVSLVMKRIIAHVLGKENVGERVLVASGL
jgi:DNA repair protein RecO (recombination protein O)